MEENLGYIKLYRKLLTSKIFANPTKLKVWIWLLIKANHKNKYISVRIGKGETDVEILRSQFLFGRHKAEDELNIDESTIYRIIKSLEKIGMITVKANNHYSIITICNYEDYQGQGPSNVTTIEQPLNNKQPTTAKGTNTTNNDENNKNEYDKFLEVFNAITEKKFTGDKSSKAQYQELVKREYKLPDFEKSIQNCLINEWHKNNKDVLTPAFITKPENFEKYLNSSKVKIDLPSHLNNMVF